MNATERSDYLVGKLLALLEKNGGRYDRMIALLDGETDALKRHDLAAIEQGVAQKNEVTAHLMSLERERVDLIGALAKETGADPASVTLRSLAAAHPKREKNLLTLRDRMNRLVAAVAQKNEFNRGLIAKLMTINTEAATNLHALTQHDSVYGRGAAASPAPFAAGKVVRRTL
ncbi:MAG: flagellar protein FlgN [Nitrospinae bacterium]|nr:flagellar protein FlgN [Nitrospinota bacterium]